MVNEQEDRACPAGRCDAEFRQEKMATQLTCLKARKGGMCGTARVIPTIVVCIFLCLPVQVCLGSSHRPAFMAGALSQRISDGSRLPCTRRCSESKLSGNLLILAMRGDDREPKFMGSRRLASWIEGLSEDGEKLLWSRRLALAVHNAHSARFKGEVGETLEPEQTQVPVEAVAPGPALCVGCPDLEAAKKSATPSDSLREDCESRAHGRPCETAKPYQEWGEILTPATSPPRPQQLQVLTAEDEALLLQGERVQKQTRTGRVGNGMVVVDVQADISTVFAVLTDLERYPERISTVRRCTIYERGTKVCKAQFALSRFQLEVNTVLRCERDKNSLRFELDKDRMPLAMEEAKGFWFLEEAPGRVGWTRVWLNADITCSNLLPTFMVDYAAARALPRATTWLRPTIEAIAQQLPPGAHNVRHVLTDPYEVPV